MLDQTAVKSCIFEFYLTNCKSLPFFYFLTFEKGRLLYIHPVGRLVDVTINFFNM